MRVPNDAFQLPVHIVPVARHQEIVERIDGIRRTYPTTKMTLEHLTSALHIELYQSSSGGPFKDGQRYGTVVFSPMANAFDPDGNALSYHGDVYLTVWTCRISDSGAISFEQTDAWGGWRSKNLAGMDRLLIELP